MLRLLQTINSRLRLRRCARVGRSPSVTGRVWIHGAGVVRIGDRVRIEATQAPVELHAGPGAELSIGDDVTIRSGASIEALLSVRIGDRSWIDGYARILDNHFHMVLGDRQTQPQSSMVVVGPDSTVGWRAILLPGTCIPGGAVVPAGRVVRGTKMAPVAPHGTSERPP